MMTKDRVAELMADDSQIKAFKELINKKHTEVCIAGGAIYR